MGHCLYINNGQQHRPSYTRVFPLNCLIEPFSYHLEETTTIPQRYIGLFLQYLRSDDALRGYP